MASILELNNKHRASNIEVDKSISNVQSSNVQGMIDVLNNTIGSTKKNLLPYPYYDTTKSTSGVTFTDVGDGSIKASGEITDEFPPLFTIIDRVNAPIKFKKGKYKVTGCPKGGSTETYRFYLAKDLSDGTSEEIGSDFGEGLEFTLEEDTTIGMYINILSAVGTTVDLTFYPMITYASVDDDTFEPYKGPSISDELATVKRTLGYTVGKNYLPNPIVNNTQYGVSCVVNSNKSVTLNGKNTNVGRVYNNLVGVADKNVYDEIKGLEDGVEYIISGTPTGSSDNSYGIYGVCQKADGTTFSINEIEDGANTFIHEKGNKYRIYIGVTGGVTVTNLTFYPMIRKASEDDTYEPYVEDVQTQIADMNGRILTIKQKTQTGTTDANGNIVLGVPLDNKLLCVRCTSPTNNTYGIITFGSGAYWFARLVENHSGYMCIPNKEVTMSVYYF